MVPSKENTDGYIVAQVEPNFTVGGILILDFDLPKLNVSNKQIIRTD